MEITTPITNKIVDLTPQSGGVPIRDTEELMDLLQEIPSDSFIEKR